MRDINTGYVRQATANSASRKARGLLSTERRRNNRLTPSDVEHLPTGSSGASDRAGDVDAGSDAVDGKRGGEEVSDGVGEDHCRGCSLRVSVSQAME